MGDDEKSLSGTKGKRCWERRARRAEMMGILLKARIMSGRSTKRVKEIEYDLDFNPVAIMCNYHNINNRLEFE